MVFGRPKHWPTIPLYSKYWKLYFIIKTKQLYLLWFYNKILCVGIIIKYNQTGRIHGINLSWAINFVQDDIYLNTHIANIFKLIVHGWPSSMGLGLPESSTYKNTNFNCSNCIPNHGISFITFTCHYSRLLLLKSTSKASDDTGEHFHL